MALPKDACDLVFATDGHSASIRNMQQTSLDRDMVFSDGYASQLAVMSGRVQDGFVAQLNVPLQSERLPASWVRAQSV